MYRHLFLLMAAITALPMPSALATERPNILLIMADDMGFSDLGCYGGEIHTPHLDRLATGGLRFTQFYNTGRCWPTRAALLTGYYPQQVRRDTLPGSPPIKRGRRPAWASLLPEMLRPLGYRSYHSGKWHIDGMPLEGGFDRSYYLQDDRRFFNPQNHFEDDKKLPPVDPASDYYSTTAIANYTIKYLRQHASEHAEQPFFAYMAFLAPHFPLHALPEDIDRYRDTYRPGWKRIREARWQRMQELGIDSGELSAVEREVGPPYHFPGALEKLGPGEIDRPLPWNELTEEQKDFQSTKMAIHAAMVDRIDREVGRVIGELRAMGALDNTLVLFLSDNGASAEIMVRGDGHDPAAPPGSAATHLCLGPGWSTVSNTPFRRHKTWVHEGGIATPLIAHWPAGIAARGELRHNPGHVIDVVPTVLEIAAGNSIGNPRTERAPSPPGKSLAPVFGKDESVVHDSIWWCHEGNRAVRVGNWKLVAAGADGPWELYDLSTDRAETHNLAERRPELVAKLQRIWSQQLEQFRSQLTDGQPQTKSRNKVAQPMVAVAKLDLPYESFLISDRPAFIMLPAEEKRREPQPWILYAPTLPGYPDEHEKWMHQQFLAAGIAVAGIDVGEAYGSPQARKLFTEFYNNLTEDRGYAPKPCLLGRSRGGLWVTSWAADHPDKVAGLAGIYPVFDLRTYPGLEKAAPAFGMSAKELKAGLATINPIERIEILARHGIPAMLIHGDRDKVVPMEQNSAEFVRRYRDAGAESAVSLTVFKYQGHSHWHGFFHCQELVDFAIARAHAGAEVDGDSGK